MSKEDYEQRLLVAVREAFMGFRVDERPGRVFGWRMPVWPTPTPDPDASYTGPEGWADLLVVELCEDRDLVVPGLTADPDADGVTWTGRRR